MTTDYQKLSETGLETLFAVHTGVINEMRQNTLDGFSWGGKLTDDELTSIAEYLRHYLGDNATNLIVCLSEYQTYDHPAPINYFSLLNYLYLSASEKVQDLTVTIDKETGRLAMIVPSKSDEDDDAHSRIDIMHNKCFGKSYKNGSVFDGDKGVFLASTPKSRSRIDTFIDIIS